MEGEWRKFLEAHARACDAVEWPGCPSANDLKIKQVEEHLGIALPPSYRTFLKTSNGWQIASRSVPVLRPVEKLRWFGKEYREWTAAYKCHSRVEAFSKEYFDYRSVDVVDFEPNHLKNALCISELGDDAVVLLNPMVIWYDGEWETWLFANWLPGTMRFRSFAEWMRFAQTEFLAERFEHQTYEDQLPTVFRDAPNKPNRRILPPPKTYTVAKLQKSLASSDEWVRKTAVKRMGTVRTKEAMNILIAALNSDVSAYVQWEAAESLGKLRFAEAVDALIEAAKDSALANSSAVCALVKIKDERGLQFLLEVVRQGGVHAGVAAHQLAERGERRVIEATKELLLSISPSGHHFGEMYAQAIAQMGTNEVFEVLAPLLGHADPRVRMRGAKGLALLGTSAKEKLIKEKTINAFIKVLTTETNTDVRRELEFDLEWVLGRMKGKGSGVADLLS